MKIYFFLILIFIVINFGGSRDDLIGTYYSVAPTKSELFSLMYINGDFNVLYTPPYNRELALKNDNTFEYTVKYCNIGEKSYYGRWSEQEGKVNLLYKDSLEPVESKIRNKKLYFVKNFIAAKNNKKYKILTIFEKQ